MIQSNGAELFREPLLVSSNDGARENPTEDLVFTIHELAVRGFNDCDHLDNGETALLGSVSILSLDSERGEMTALEDTSSRIGRCIDKTVFLGAVAVLALSIPLFYYIFIHKQT